MATQPSAPRRNHKQAVAYMLAAVIGISLTPLWIAWSNGAGNPFFFNAVLRLDVAIVFAVYLWAAFRHFLLDREILGLLRARIFSWLILFTIIASFDFAVFAWASRFVDISVAAILFELWAIFIIFFMHRLFRDEQIYKPMDRITVILLFFGFLGVAFVISSQSGELAYHASISSWTFMFGVCLAIIGAIISAFAAFNFRWSTNFANEIVANGKAYDMQSLNMFAAVFAYALGSAVAAPTSFVIGMLSGETTSFNSMLVVFGGALAQGTGSVLWRKSNLLSDSPTINAIAYAIPILSLGWLALFSLVGVARVDYLIIGAAAIITANLLINFEAEVRFGFKALVVSLWACGAFVLLRDDFLHFLPFESWLWPGEPFLGALGLSATVFTLLLAFRVARLASRTQDEDNAIFVLFQNLDLLARRGVIDAAVREHVLAIDGAHSPEELRSAYGKARLCIIEAVAANSAADDLARLAEAEAQLNTIVHSRRHGVEFGELFALIIFGGITVLLSLLSRPSEISGWAGFMFEAFAFSFSAVIIFLIVDVWDLHRDRTSHILEKDPESGNYGVVFRDARNRRFEQGTSVVIGIAITACYIALLWQKWLPGNVPAP